MVAALFILQTESFLYRTLMIVGGSTVGLLFVAQTDQGHSFIDMLREARLEIRKVVWPTHPETVQTLLLVFLFVCFMAVVLWVLDSILGWFAGLFIG